MVYEGKDIFAIKYVGTYISNMFSWESDDQRPPPNVNYTKYDI
jgi:hypothetical protein